MRALLMMLFAVLVAPLALASAAHAQTVYVALYVEAAPNATGQALGLLKDYSAATRKEDGNLRSRVLQERSRPSRFVVIEAWKDQASLDAHHKAGSATTLKEKLASIQNSPPDERAHNSFLVADALPDSARGGVWVVTHVDVPPPKKDDVMAELKTLTEASRKDSGNQMFEVVQQSSRPNHLTVVETWKSPKAYDAHGTGAATRAFRAKLTPMSGALYDERLFKAVD